MPNPIRRKDMTVPLHGPDDPAPLPFATGDEEWLKTG
jgi:hypothetical protein